jgi:beta-lactamase regulating signal transducer with metallopeptidase domain
MDIWVSYSHSVGLTLLHSIWQAALIYLVLQIRPSKQRSLSAFALYWPTIILTLVMLTTFIGVGQETAKSFGSAVGTLSTSSGWMPVFLVFWFVGMSFQFARLSLDYLRLVYWRSQGHVITEGIVYDKMIRLSRKLKVNSQIKLKMVNDLTVPMVIGFLKPLILFPVCLVNQLSSEEIDGILLHELSHIKRRDYLWNLILRGMEVILFFNPFVHLIIKETRIQREMSCDKVAAVVSRQPKALANALLRIEEISQNPKLAMALNSEGQLTQRIYSLLNIGVHKKRPTSSLGSMLAILAFIPFAFAFEVHESPTFDNLTSGIAVDSITIPGIKHKIHSLEFKTTGGTIKDVKINDETVSVSDKNQLESLKNKMSSGSTSSNRSEEYNLGLEKKFHDARIKARKDKLIHPEYKVKLIEEEESASLNSTTDQFNLASIEGYHFGKAFDTLHQWFELTISDDELKSMRDQKNQIDKTYFFHLPTDPEPKAHKDVIFLYEDDSKEHTKSSKPLFEGFDVDEVMEMMLIDYNLLSTVSSYKMTLSQEQLVINGKKADSQIHGLFKDQYIYLLGKNPSSKFNYQIFKNQVQ